MIWVGLTGGIASGKSTVSQIFKEAGAFVVDADQIAHDLLKKEGKGYRPVLDAFGTRVLDHLGEIDRKKLGNIVFRNPEKRAILNGMIHPFVFEIAEEECRRIIAAHPDAVIIFDAPLLIETKAHEKMDILLLVYVDRITQIARLCQRDGLSPSDAEDRLVIQIPLDKKVQFANEVIDNSRSAQEVRAEVIGIYEKLCVAATSWSR